jgi:hypothetical protein
VPRLSGALFLTIRQKVAVACLSRFGAVPGCDHSEVTCVCVACIRVNVIAIRLRRGGKNRSTPVHSVLVPDAFMRSRLSVIRSRHRSGMLKDGVAVGQEPSE